MEQALAAIHQANPSDCRWSSVSARTRRTAVLFCRFPPELAAVVTSQLAAHYPAGAIRRLADDGLVPPAEFQTGQSNCDCARLVSHPPLFAVRRHAQSQRLRSADGHFRHADRRYRRERFQASIVITARPARPRRIRRARKAVRRLASPSSAAIPRLARWYASGFTSRMRARIRVPPRWGWRLRPQVMRPGTPSLTTSACPHATTAKTIFRPPRQTRPAPL